jgi:hypothetical protein
VPSVHWNESVFRFNLVRHLLAQNAGLDCRTEWNRVDLVIQLPEGATLVELKFYAAQPTLCVGHAAESAFADNTDQSSPKSASVAALAA